MIFGFIFFPFSLCRHYASDVLWTNLNPREMVEKLGFVGKDEVLEVMDKVSVIVIVIVIIIIIIIIIKDLRKFKCW